MKNLDLKLLQRFVFVVAVAIMTACSWLTPFESTANQQLDTGLKRALTSFASARALNAAISVVQGTELAAQPFGVGVKVSLGQVLRPVNDVVEQFAHLMLVASVALGIERILMTMGAHWVVSLALTAVAIGWVFFFLRDKSSPTWLTKILAVLLIIRFAMPIAIIGSDILFQQFMAYDFENSQQIIEETTGKLIKQQSIAATSTDDHGKWDKVKGWVAQHADINVQLTNLVQVAEHATERAIKLMVIFVLQTMILPIFMLWVLWGVAKGTFELPPGIARIIDPRKKVQLAQTES